MSVLRGLAALAVVGAGSAAAPRVPTAPSPRVTVLAVSLNNLSTLPDDPPARLGALGAALRMRLADECGYNVVPVDSIAEARGRAGPGYYYDHPDAGAQLASAAGAEWALIPRLNRASPWVTDLQLHVVRVADGAVVSNRVVELKGFGMSDDLTARLTQRGAAWMADQVDQAIGWSTAPRARTPRRCPA
jgi:hypothetical protein